jgi:hypothetical protein
MTSAANSIAAGPATGVAVREKANRSTILDERTIRSAISRAMQSAQDSLGKGAALQLEAMLGGDERSWRRRLTGDRIPEGETAFAMLMSRLGPRMILAATGELSEQEFEIFWDEMTDAVLRARLHRRQNKGPF